MDCSHNAVILCPGPSLARLRRWRRHERSKSDPGLEPSPNLLIAVNRAALAFHCDVWAAGDWPLIQNCRDEVNPRTTLLTTRNAKQNLWSRAKEWSGSTHLLEDLFDYCPRRLRYAMYTATFALVYAAWRGARRIEVYGADWDGSEDYDGMQAGQNRSKRRWNDEGAIWENLLVPWLAERDVSVERIRAAAPMPQGIACEG